MKPTILVVDDTPDNLSLLRELLKVDYQVQLANGGERALKLAALAPHPDLILLDIMMPDIDGYEVCRRLKSNPLTRHIPVLFVTAKSDVADEQHGLEMGAVDYITKPISPPIVLARIKIHLALKTHADFLRDKSHFLEAEVTKRTREVTAIQDVTILAMASLAETRDSETGNHIRRTQFYVKALAQHLSTQPQFAAQLTDSYIQMLFKSAPLHDIGKVGIPDSILQKPGKLTAEEYTIMKNHPLIGAQALAKVIAGTAHTGEKSFLDYARQMVEAHHERWDGSGYPHQLRGTAIPLAGRLMALADVYDALISKRIYKRGFSHEEVRQMLIEESGSHFDPDVVAAFLAREADFLQIAKKFADPEVAPNGLVGQVSAA